MLRTLHAREFVRPADRGRHQPILLLCRSDAGEPISVYVKTRAGYADRPAAQGVELFTTLLARHLKLLAPEPVLVDIPAGFERLVFDAPAHQDLVRLSHGINFGTVALGPDWKAWPVDMSTRSFPNDLLGDILTFDALVQNTDRRPEHPELLWRYGHIAVLDHENCFRHFNPAANGPQLWRDFLAARPFQNHCIRRCLPTPPPNLAQRLWHELLEPEFPQTIAEFDRLARSAFPAAAPELDRILNYFLLLDRDTSDFFDYFRASLDL